MAAKKLSESVRLTRQKEKLDTQLEKLKERRDLAAQKVVDLKEDGKKGTKGYAAAKIKVDGLKDAIQALKEDIQDLKEEIKGAKEIEKENAKSDDDEEEARAA